MGGQNVHSDFKCICSSESPSQFKLFCFAVLPNKNARSSLRSVSCSGEGLFSSGVRKLFDFTLPNSSVDRFIFSRHLWCRSARWVVSIDALTCPGLSLHINYTVQHRYCPLVVVKQEGPDPLLEGLSRARFSVPTGRRCFLFCSSGISAWWDGKPGSSEALGD